MGIFWVVLVLCDGFGLLELMLGFERLGVGGFGGGATLEFNEVQTEGLNLGVGKELQHHEPKSLNLC